MIEEFDERNAEKSRKVCQAMERAASTGKRALTERERRILEMWPKYDDGEYVMLGDAFMQHCGVNDVVERFDFEDANVHLWGESGYDCDLGVEPVIARLVQSVLDADGVEIKVGDTVYTRKGEERIVKEINFDDDECPEHTVWCGEYKFGYRLVYIADDLTHTMPDSWERLEEDVDAIRSGDGMFHKLNGYCNVHGLSGDDVFCLVIGDLVRRAKAISGAEAERRTCVS